jgi:raffinose/stachyose/melibiose transport system substrate-binding protein
MKKGFLGVMLTAAMVSGVFAGVASAEEKTQIRVYIGGDNADLNQQLVNDFNAQSEDVEAEIVTLTEGQSGYQMLTVMYNSNSAPNVFFLESGDILALQDKLADVSDLECMQYAAEGTLDDVTVDGRILGAPVKMQAYGMIYSKAVAANALGEDFDPASIKTLEDFTAVCDTLEETGVAGTIISPFNWSLGNHYFNMVYSGQDDPDAFVASLKEGTADLANNAVFNSYMDTFDVMMKYNYYKENPLEDAADEAVKQAQRLFTEEAMFWFQGSWESSVIRQLDTESEYGFIPVPLASEEENNSGRICTLVPGYFCVDTACSTEEQQAAAREFITFATMSDAGQQYVIDDGNIPAYTNNDKEISESLVLSAFDYASEGATFPMYTKYPSDHYEAVGNLMQQYLAGEIDRAGLAEKIEAYWNGQA